MLKRFQRKATQNANQRVASLARATAKQERALGMAPRAPRRQRRMRGANPHGPNAMRRPRGMPGQQIGRGGDTVTTRSTSRRGQVLEEDEYIGEVNGSVAFATTQYAINPGQAATFPWGSQIAALYEEYEFEYLEFYYTAEVSQYATQGQTGVVLLSADYDSSDAPPATKQRVEDTDPHTTPALPSTKLIRLVMDCAQMKRNLGKYVRPGAQPVNTDIKTYDSGNLFVSTQGQTNTTNIGELHVRYRVRLSKPVLESSGGALGQPGSQLLLTSALAGETAAATTVAGLCFASATNPVVVQNSIGATFASTGLVTLPAGTYLIEAGNTCVGSAAAPSALGLSLVQSSTLTNYLQTNATTSTAGSGSTYSLQPRTLSINSFVLNTSVAGSAVIGLAAYDTYASGSATNNAWLRVTLL